MLQTHRIQPLKPFGVEIDIDLNAEKDVAEELLPALFAEHNLLVFRKQSLSQEDQRRVMSWLGPVLTGGPALDGYVSNVRDDGLLKNVALAFHSDFSYRPHPVLGISLHAVEVEDGASSTRFVSGRRALDQLPEATRARVIDRQSVHVSPTSASALRNGVSAEDADDAEALRAEQPVVIKDPTSSYPALYVNEQNTAKINDVPREESDQLLQELYGYLYDESNVYEHHWYNGDLVIWSNITLQHARSELKSDSPRTLQRVVISDATVEEYALQKRSDRDY